MNYCAELRCTIMHDKVFGKCRKDVERAKENAEKAIENFIDDGWWQDWYKGSKACIDAAIFAADSAEKKQLGTPEKKF